MGQTPKLPYESQFGTGGTSDIQRRVTQHGRGSSSCACLSRCRAEGFSEPNTQGIMSTSLLATLCVKQRVPTLTAACMTTINPVPGVILDLSSGCPKHIPAACMYPLGSSNLPFWVDYVSPITIVRCVAKAILWDRNESSSADPRGSVRTDDKVDAIFRFSGTSLREISDT